MNKLRSLAVIPLLAITPYVMGSCATSGPGVQSEAPAPSPSTTVTVAPDGSWSDVGPYLPPVTAPAVSAPLWIPSGAPSGAIVFHVPCKNPEGYYYEYSGSVTNMPEGCTLA